MKHRRHGVLLFALVVALVADVFIEQSPRRGDSNIVGAEVGVGSEDDGAAMASRPTRSLCEVTVG